jgi:hypothetical protein
VGRTTKRRSQPALVWFLNGPLAMVKVELSATPPRVRFGSVMYSQVVDPETGEFLGAYALEQEFILDTRQQDRVRTTLPR